METPSLDQVSGEHQVSYIPEEHQFQMMVNGESVKISTLEAVMFVLQQRYVAMSDVTAERTREMQQQVNLIKEANRWLNAVTDATIDGDFERPAVDGDDDSAETESDTDALLAWMNSHDLDTSGYQDPPTIEDFKHAQTQISNYVDQLSSNNDLRMLSLKTAVNKAQQAMTAADGVLQNIKQLMQTITSNMSR